MTVETLKDCNKKILARMAKDQGIVGWHAMRKDQLIRALTPVPAGARKNKSKEAEKGRPRQAGPPPTASRKPVIVPPRPLVSLPRSSRSLDHGCGKDRIIVMVRDPYWLHAYWELSRSTLGRAQAALGQEWHTAKPILRLMDVSSEDTTSATERHVRDIEIHGRRWNNWYIDVNNPPRSFRVDVGYLSRRGKFFVLARSNVVSTPRASRGVRRRARSRNWSSVQDSYQKIYHQSGGSAPQRPLDRPPRDLRGGPPPAHAQPVAPEPRHRRPAAPGSRVPLRDRRRADRLRGDRAQRQGDAPGRARPSSGPTAPSPVRLSLPDARQIIPAAAASPDGSEERTIVLAVERNTKELEPMIHDGNEL